MLIKTKVWALALGGAVFAIVQFGLSHVSAEKLEAQNKTLSLVTDKVQDGIKDVYSFVNGDKEAAKKLREQEKEITDLRNDLVAKNLFEADKVKKLEQFITSILNNSYGEKGIVAQMEEHGRYNTGLYAKILFEIHEFEAALGYGVVGYTNNGSKNKDISFEIKYLEERMRQRERVIFIYSNGWYDRPTDGYMKSFEKDVDELRKAVSTDKMFSDSEKSLAFSHLDTYVATFKRAIEIQASVQKKIRALKNTSNELDETIISLQSDLQVNSARGSKLRLFVLILGLVAGLIAAHFINKAIMTPIGKLNSSMEKLSAGTGDLTFRLDETGSDELATTSKLFNRFISHLQALVTDIKQSIEDLEKASEIIADSSSEISSAITKQSEETSAVSAAIEETTASIHNVSETITGVNRNTQETEANLKAAETSQEKANVAIEHLVSLLQKVIDATSTIKGISFQTNILALNAAVEAARAGDQGRGFAVVAVEVRDLAQRAGKSAHEIDHLMESIRDSADQVVTTSREVNSTISSVCSIAHKTTDSVSDIANAMTEQRSAGNLVSKKVEAIAFETEKNSSASRQIDEQIQGFRSVTKNLGMIVSQFKTT